MKTTKRILMFLVALIATTGAWADELTVYEGDATSSYVPVYGFYADAYLKCEMVMPADDLTAMNGGTISSLAFHINAPASDSWGSANFVVFLKEISGTTISAYTGYDANDVVYEGGLDGTGETLDVTFTKNYTYQGGNLLIGVYCVETGNYKSISYKGTALDGACVQGYSYSSLDGVSATQRNFLPMTTFTYTAGDVDTSLALSVGETEHGTIDLTVGGVAADKAEEGDEVVVAVTPDDGWDINEVKAMPYTVWGGAKAPSQAPDILKIELVPVDGVNNQWAFTMPAYPVEVSATYQKIIQPEWIEPLEDFVFNGKAIEPALVITDGDKILVEGTDYTVAYANNVNVGEATITVTGINYYTGVVVVTFNIVRLEDPDFKAPTAIEGLVFNGEEQELIIPGEIEYAFLLYSLSTATSSFSNAVPTAKDANQYTVYYKISGNANVKGSGIMSLTVAIAPKPAEDVELKFEVKEDGTLFVGDADTELIDGVDFDLTILDANGKVVDLNEEAPEEELIARRALNLYDLGLEPGDYKAIIEFKGNYTGTIEKEFTITGTGISTVKAGVESDATWYTLDGRRLQGMPAKAGIYVVNGKKVVIK